MAEAPELHDVAAEEQRGRPVGDDAELPREQRQLVQVVRPRHPPAEEAAQGQAHHLGDALVPAERGHLAHHPVAVRLGIALEVLREPPRLAERVLARRRVRQLAARVRDARAVAERPHVLVAAHAQQLVHLDAPALVEREAELADERMRPDAGRPDERPRRDARPVAEDGLVRVQRRERRADPDLDAALRQLVRGVVAEPRRNLGEDHRRRVDEHPAPRDVLQARVVAGRVVDEIGQLRQRLDARVARADEDEGQPALPLRVVERRVGVLQLAEHVVAEMDRLGQRLEGEGVLGESRHRHRPRHRAEGDHQLLPADRLRAGVGLDRRRARLQVDGGRAPEQQLRVRAHRPERDDRVARLQRPRCGLRQQRRVEHEVLRRDDRRPALAEQACDVGPGEAASEDEHATTRAALAHLPLLASRAWQAFRSRSSAAARSTRSGPRRWDGCSPSAVPSSSPAAAAR